LHSPSISASPTASFSIPFSTAAALSLGGTFSFKKAGVTPFESSVVKRILESDSLGKLAIEIPGDVQSNSRVLKISWKS
jgi:hypothetical protein